MEHDDNNNFLQQITKRLETVFSNNARNYSLYRQMLSIVTIEVLNKVCNSVCSIASPIFKLTKNLFPRLKLYRVATVGCLLQENSKSS